MAIAFKAKTKKEIQEENLLPEGIYPFEVLEAQEKKSKKGNDMIELKLRVFAGERTVQLLDWIMEAMSFKLYNFCDYTGLKQQYESGALRGTDCIGRTGYCKIIIQDDKTGEYPSRNSVKDYVAKPANTIEIKAAAEKAKEKEDDSIPF